MREITMMLYLETTLILTALLLELLLLAEPRPFPTGWRVPLAIQVLWETIRPGSKPTLICLECMETMFLASAHWSVPLVVMARLRASIDVLRIRSWILFPSCLECDRVRPTCIADLILEITKWRIITLNKHTGRFLNTAILDPGLALRIVLFSWTKIQTSLMMVILNILQMALTSTIDRLSIMAIAAPFRSLTVIANSINGLMHF